MTIKIALKGNILNSQPIPEKFTPNPITADINLKSKPVNGSGFDDISLGFSTLIERQVGINQDSDDKILFGGNSSSADEASCDPNRAEMIMLSRLFTSDVSGSLSIKKFEATLDIEDYTKIVNDLKSNSTLSSDISSRENAALSQKSVSLNNIKTLQKIYDYKNDFIDGTNFLINQESFHESSRAILNDLPSKYVAYSGTRTLDISRTLPEISANLLTPNISNFNSLQVLLRKLADPASTEYATTNLTKENVPTAVGFTDVSTLLKELSSYESFNEKLTDFKTFSGTSFPPNFVDAETLINDSNGNLENRLKTIAEMLSYEILVSNGLTEESIENFKSRNFPFNLLSSIIPENGDPGSYFKSIEGYQPHETSGANSLVDDALKAGDVDFQNLQRFTDGLSDSWGEYLDSIKEMRFPSNYDSFSSTGIVIDIIKKIFCPNNPDYKNIGILGSALKNVEESAHPYFNSNSKVDEDLISCSSSTIRSFLFREYSGELSEIEGQYFNNLNGLVDIKVGNFILGYIWNSFPPSDSVESYTSPEVITQKYFDNKIQNSVLYSQIEEFYQNIVTNLSIYDSLGRTKASGLSEPAVRFLCFELAMTVCALFNSVQIVVGPLGIGFQEGILEIDDSGVIVSPKKPEKYYISHIGPNQNQLDAFRAIGNFGSLDRNNIVNTLQDYDSSDPNNVLDQEIIDILASQGITLVNNDISYETNSIKSALLWLTEREEYIRERYSLARYYLDNYVELASALYDGFVADLEISNVFQTYLEKLNSLSSDTISATQLSIELSRYPMKLGFRNAEPRYTANLLQLFSNFLNSAASPTLTTAGSLTSSGASMSASSTSSGSPVSMPAPEKAQENTAVVTENYVIAAIGLPAMTKYNLVTKSASSTGYSITSVDESSFVDITLSKKDTQFSELEFSRMSFSFYPYVHCIALPQEDYDNLESTLDSLLFFKYEEQSWICCSKSDATEFISTRTGLVSSDSEKVIKNHMVDAICKSAMRVLGGVSIDEMLPKYSIPKMTQAGYDLFVKILTLPDASKYISPRGLQLGDFLRQVDGEYEFIPFSELDPRIVARTDEPTHRLLQILITDPIFNYESYYPSFESIPSFERVYFVLFDPEEFYIEEGSGLQGDVLSLLKLDGILSEVTVQTSSGYDPVTGTPIFNVVERLILTDLGPGSTGTKLDISEYSATVYLKNTKFIEE